MNGNMSTPEKKIFQIRLPPSVYTRLVETANKNRRSFNSEIIVILEEYFQSKKDDTFTDFEERVRKVLSNIMEAKAKLKGF